MTPPGIDKGAGLDQARHNLAAVRLCNEQRAIVAHTLRFP